MNWLSRLLFDWVYRLLFGLFQGLLNLTKFIESFFDIFAGTAKIFYKGEADFLINIFFGHDAVTNAFWAMALIAIVMAFGFCIFQMARKATDVTGSVKQSVGQIFSSFIRCLLIILLLNAITVAAINISNVLLDRINFALENAAVLDQQEQEKTFSDEEYAAMVKILATVANYSANPSADSRYNVNSCFNAIRNDLMALHVNGFFRYDYPLDKNGHYTWQGALALLASSADLTGDLNLDTYYPDVVNAFRTVSRELSTYKDFAPVEKARFTASKALDTDVLIFLIAGMEAAQNKMYNTGDFNDAIRKGYASGEKSYNNLKQVRRDFDIWEMDYLVGYISCIVFIIIMAICIFTFIVRMFNLLLLYLTAPLFASSMPADEGAKWQSWTQAFVIQLFSGFGLIIAMRLYLIIIPVVISSDLVFFAGTGLGYSILNKMAQLLMVLGGAWAVLQSGDVITGILAGNPGMAAIQQSGRIGGMVTGWAMRAPRAALGAAKSIASSPFKAASAIKGAQAKAEAGQQRKVERMDRRAQQKQNKADALYAQADKRIKVGKHDRTTQGLMARASDAQVAADSAKYKAAHKREQYGMGGYAGERPGSQEMEGFGHSASDAGGPDVPVISSFTRESRAGAEPDISTSTAVPARTASDTTSDATATAVPARAVSDAPSDAASTSGESTAVAAATSARQVAAASSGAIGSTPTRPSSGGTEASSGSGTGTGATPPPPSARRVTSSVVSDTASSTPPRSSSDSTPPPKKDSGDVPVFTAVPQRTSGHSPADAPVISIPSPRRAPPPPRPSSGSTPPPKKDSGDAPPAGGGTPPRKR